MSNLDISLEFEIDLDEEAEATVMSDGIGATPLPLGASTTEIRRADLALARKVGTGVRPLPAADLAPVPMLFVFESGTNEVQRALSQMGIASKTVGLGGELMSAVQSGEVSGVLFSPTMDEEMRTFLARAFKGRFPKIPLIVTTASGLSADDKQALGGAGVRAVFPWPLPPASELLPALDAILLERVPKDAVPKRGSLPALNELEILRRKVAELEKERTDVHARVINPAAFEQVVKEVAEKTAENTSLRSERTLLKQRTLVLEERVTRLSAELERLRAQAPHPAPSATGKVLSEELVVLLEGADAFLWPLGQAVDFFDDLAHQAGNSRSPSLETHVRSLKLLRGLLERLRDGFHDAS